MEAIDLSKKRKLQTDQFDSSPLPKHVCFHDKGEASLSKSCEPCYDSNNSSDQCSEIESVKDSNSFTMAEASASSVSSGPMECSDETRNESSSSSLGEEMLHHHLGFIYGTGELDGYKGKDIVDILYPDDEVKDHNATYVLSSGRWAVNRDSSLQNTMKPTIDQEFEQYFSMLML
ncbi:PREDICTED: protein FAR-RED ELONGATED HYPOCOTYL 1 isoform X2 [Tarenaya hassleriana]|nr:PREDICTED: protein FAR-RED ELONGATED HYPOCOTYL 1 isoform X2 [Tarenaya hassleriana]